MSEPLARADTASNHRDYPFSREQFDRLRQISVKHTGIMVPDNKFEMFYARLIKRLRALNLSGFDAYVALVSDERSAEFTPFINAMTTNLTAFFRERHHFVFLRDQVIAQARATAKPVNIWSAGCSSGEETWSIAMVLGQADKSKKLEWSLLATDLDTEMLARAQAGIYSQERLQEVPEPLQHNWFLRGKGGRSDEVRVKQSLRNKVEFRQLNLIKSFDLKTQFDVIFCRNVIIYFDRDTKKDLIERYAKHLRLGGYLILGHSETLNGISDRFQGCGQTIYQKVR